MGVWAFGRWHRTVRVCGGGLGSTFLVGYLCSLSFPFVCLGVACNILVQVPPYPYLILFCLFCLLRRRHTCCSLVLPMQASVQGWACSHYYSTWLVTYLCWSFVRLLLRLSVRGVARHVKYVLLYLCVCASSSALLSLHGMLLVRGGGGRVVLAATCLCEHALHSLCVWRAGVGAVHPCVCEHTFLSFCRRVGVDMALGCSPTCVACDILALLVAVCGSLLAYHSFVCGTILFVLYASRWVWVCDPGFTSVGVVFVVRVSWRGTYDFCVLVFACWSFSWSCVVPYARPSRHSWRSSYSSVPFCLFAALVVLLRFRRHARAGIPFAPFRSLCKRVYGPGWARGHVLGWACLGYTSWSPLLAWLSFLPRVRCVA